MSPQPPRFVLGVLFTASVWAIVLAGAPTARPADGKYQTAAEAFGVGAAHYNARNFAASRGPFEAALKMAPDDAFRLKCYEALIPAYRQDGGVNKMIEACEFIITHADQPARQSLTRRDLLSFLFQRGKIDEYVKRHEQVLKKDPNQWLSLYMLSEIYSRMKEQPDRAAELIDRLAALDEQSGTPRDLPQQAQLAQQYVRAKKYQQGAELYESIAPLDEKLAAWHWKEAAAAWLAAGQKDKALAAAQKSAASPAETRSELLTHFWHRGLADVFLKAGDPKSAIPHYEQAIRKTNIEGYIKDCEKSLAEARKTTGE